MVEWAVMVGSEVVVECLGSEVGVECHFQAH